MTAFVYNILKAKGIDVTSKECEELQTQWDHIQEKKEDFDDVGQDSEDIILSPITK